MTTVFALILRRLGLSQAGAAALLDVRPDTIASWSSGRNPVRQSVIDELRAREATIVSQAAEREATIVSQAAEMLAAWREAGQPREIDVSLSGGDEMVLAAFALALPAGVSIRLVERDATSGVAGRRSNRAY